MLFWDILGPVTVFGDFRMFTALAFGAVLAVSPPQDAVAPPSAQVPQEAPIRLEDVISNPRRLEDATEQFVGEVAAPVRRRGYARWHNGVCVGVANLAPEVGQAIADRVSDRARELGLVAGEPGCEPSILVVATRDATPFTAQFVAMRPRLFRTGATGMDRGGAAFRRFLETDRPVRWWTVSQPTDADTGAPTVRMPGLMYGLGYANASGSSAQDFAPKTLLRNSGRLVSQYRQDIKRTFVIVDVDRLNGASVEQLGDYISMVSLAQIDQDADTSSFDTVLNLFDNPAAVPGMTSWDTAYLQGLYGTAWYRINQGSQVQAIAREVEERYRDRDAGGEPR